MTAGPLEMHCDFVATVATSTGTLFWRKQRCEWNRISLRRNLALFYQRASHVGSRAKQQVPTSHEIGHWQWTILGILLLLFRVRFRRNQNVKDIMKGLGLGPKNLSHFDITTRFHHLFFLGDLNYRLAGIEATVRRMDLLHVFASLDWLGSFCFVERFSDCFRQEIINKVTQLEKQAENLRDYSSLLFHDQLRRSQQEKEVFCQFRKWNSLCLLVLWATPFPPFHFVELLQTVSLDARSEGCRFCLLGQFLKF